MVLIDITENIVWNEDQKYILAGKRRNNGCKAPGATVSRGERLEDWMQSKDSALFVGKVPVPFFSYSVCMPA